MPQSRKRNHRTELQTASIVSSGSGDILIGGSFVPTPTIPINGSNLPNRHSNFVGRQDEIGNVMDALSSRAWIVTIDGMGGIGKTTLALEAAHLCRERGSYDPHIPEFTGYIWTSARDKADFCLDDVIRETLYVLSSFETRTGQLAPSEQLSLAIRALAAEPRLLIIDNFETVQDEPLHRFLRDQLPDPSKVLITSRHHIRTGEKVITIGGLGEEDALKMLHLEAARLQIPLGNQDTARLRIIAQKSFGIPLVLRWVMESVYDGKSLEWVLESLEHATAEDIFDYIFKRSLSTLDPKTRDIFRSMSLVPTWASIETITAMNPGIPAIQERIGHLVSLSLVDDNRSLVEVNRRYQLPPFTRYLALKELADTDDRGKSVIKHALKHYLDSVQGFKPHSELSDEYLKSEFLNIHNITQTASAFEDSVLLELCIQLAERVSHLDHNRGRTLFRHFIEPVDKMSSEVLTLRLFEAVGNPYISGPPVRPPMFFGRKDLLRFIQEGLESGRLSVISLVGQRRVGKTSLLIQLSHQAPTNCVYVYIDFQAALLEDTAHLLWYMASSIGDTLADRGFEVSEPELGDFTNKSYRAFDSFIEDALKSLGTVRLILAIDEFDMLFYEERSHRFDTMSLLNYFRSVVQRGTFGMIIVGVTPLHELPSPAVGSPFFNIAVSKRVSFLDREAAIELIQRPTYALLKYDTRAIELLLTLSGCHPYLLQLMCYQIVKICGEKKKLLVDAEMVEEVASDTFETSYFFFDYLMKHLTSEEQLVVQAAASLAEARKGSFTINQLEQTLDESELQVSQLENLLHQLERREIIARDSKGNYSFTMEIFRRWVIESAARTRTKS